MRAHLVIGGVIMAIANTASIAGEPVVLNPIGTIGKAQRVLKGGFNLLPLMLRQQDQQLMEILGEILGSLLENRDTLLIASSDLSHFNPAGVARELDQTIIRGIKSLDPGSLYLAEKTGTGSACGLGAMAAVMTAAKAGGSTAVKILNYSHSGEITGDNSSVVGYASAVLTRE